MFRHKNILAILTLFILFAATENLKAQNGPVMYFCEKYGSSGEEGISDRFTTGYLTVMVKCDYALNLSKVTIQFDKYNCRTGKFEYYKDFPYTVKPTMKYIYFEGEDLSFNEAGTYRVFLLDEYRKTVTSALIEIIR
jgi:hypothetical protein